MLNRKIATENIPPPRQQLNIIAASYLPLLSITIAIVVTAYNIFNILGVTQDFNRLVIAHDTFIGICTFAIAYFSWRYQINPNWIHPIMTIIALNLSASTLHSMYLNPRPIFSFLFIMTFLAIGALFLSRIWALVTIALSALGWILVAYHHISSTQFIDFGLAILAAFFVSMMLIQNRIIIHQKIIMLRIKDEKAKKILADSLVQTQEEIAERKKAEAEKTRLEQQLRQAQKMEAVGRLAGGMAHDINNMLAAIAGTTEALLQENRHSPTLFEDLDSILRACARGKELTTNLLGFAQKGKYRQERIDLNQTIEDVHTFMNRTIPSYIQFETILSKELLPTQGDPGQINQVLVNLVNNAVDAMDLNGHLVITTENVQDIERQGVVGLENAQGNYIKVVVSDTGHGMKEGTLEKAFEPFFSTKKMGHGTGLGLSMVYGTITNHGGAVLIRSALSQGTSVTLYLPEHKHAGNESAKDSGEYLLEEQKIGTILLVDDEPLVRRSGIRILHQMGYKVLSATSGKEALRVYEEHSNEIDLVILDLIMPGMDGDEVFEKLHDKTPNVRVIFVSAYSKDSIRVDNLLTQGALDFIQKPFSIKQIGKAIDNAIPTIPPDGSPRNRDRK